MDTQTLEKLIRSKKLITPLLVFSGPETFLKEKAFALMVSSFIPEMTRLTTFRELSAMRKNCPKPLI